MMLSLNSYERQTISVKFNSVAIFNIGKSWFKRGKSEEKWPILPTVSHKGILLFPKIKLK